MKDRKTDYGTIILHWSLVLALSVAFLSGLRIATETPERGWINLFDALLPHKSVWITHMQAAVVLVAVAFSYAIYLVRSGLSRRVKLDAIRLKGLFGRREARLGAFNAILCWTFYVAMLISMASGGALYFAVLAGHKAAALHWYSTWVMLAFVVLHILTHFRIGGASQLFRIFRPAMLPAPPPRLDAGELLALLAEQTERQAQGARPAQHASPRYQIHSASNQTASQRQGKPVPDAKVAASARQRTTRRPNPTLQSNPLVVAVSIALTGVSLMLATDRLSVESLEIRRIDHADAPKLDGDTSDRAWRNAMPYFVTTAEGGNFDGKGETRIEIRAVHDGTWAYFLFIWEDSTRSLKHLPLVKNANGWRVLHNGLERGDEHEFNEDKFAVLLTTMDVTLPGDNTFHASPQPIPDAPRTMTGRGLHFTTTGYADVWQWKATSSSSGWMDDDHFGPPLQPTPMQTHYIVPYKGGFAPDPGTANYSENLAIETDAAGGARIIAPRRLPKNLAPTTEALGEIDLNPNRGEEDGARWFMTESESVPYSIEDDARIPVGTVIPDVIIAGEFTGDRADVRCAARWASGHWALEVARRLDTNSEFDVPIKSGVFMRVAAFDHSQIRHTRHVRPIRLEVE